MNQQSPWQPQLPQRRRTFRQWFRAQTRFAKFGLGCGSLFLVLMLCICSLVACGSTQPQPKVAPTQTTSVAINNISPTATLSTTSTDTSTLSPSPTATPTATPSPTPKPNPTPSPTPKPDPTPSPTPKPSPTPRPTRLAPRPTPCPGVNCNPWGYNFNAGNLIYNPPSNFCDYFNCIPSFWGRDDPGDGYIIQCTDGDYSQSGGERGACSYHGGEMRPLYSH